MNIKDLLHLMIEKRASDLHLKEGRPPLFRIDGKLQPLDMAILSNTDLKEAIYFLTDEKQRKKFEDSNEIDLAYNLEGVARFRANAFRQMGRIEIVLRAIPIKIPTLEELNLPVILNEVALYPRGLVLVTGTTGSGKSTTLAAMINKINENYNHHIVTIEDPIEFVHSDKKSSISQREVGLDTETFASALKYVLRQDPDVILIGEIRDKETVTTALSAAETGHMVFSTLHTIDTIQTINRILDFFPKEQQRQVAIQLAGALRAVISLRLVTKADGIGRVPGVEVMIVTPTVRGYIEELKLNAIKDLIRDGGQFGMQTFDQSLISLYKKGLITIDEARKNATSQQEIDLALKGISSSKASAQSILDSMLKEQQKKEFDNLMKQGKTLLSSGRYKEAYEFYEKLLNKYPDNQDIKDTLNSIQQRLNKEQFQESIKAILAEGLNIYKKGNIKGAIVKWQEGLNLDPDNEQLKLYIKNAEEKIQVVGNITALLEEGVKIYSTGKVLEAIEKWKEVFKIEPGNLQAKNYIQTAEQKLEEIRKKKEIEELHSKGMEAFNSGNALEAISLLKRALNSKPNDENIKKDFDQVYKSLMSENFGGTDVEAAITMEAFQKGLEKFLEEDYLSTIKEWKKAIEKRPLEKKLKDYLEKVKEILKKRLEGLMERVDTYYRNKQIVNAMACINEILKIDPTNEFALQYLHDIKPLVENTTQEMYKEAMELYSQNKLKDTKEKLEQILKIDPNHVTAKKRLEEVNERIEKLKDIG
jgi:twitching motility protein PilT